EPVHPAHSPAKGLLPEAAAGAYCSEECSSRGGLGKENPCCGTVSGHRATTGGLLAAPGQSMVIHLRALALRPFDLKPVEKAPILFEVEDGKGNKVFKKTLTTSDFGIAAVDFQLADEVNMGDYQLKAALGEARAQKTVTVKRYVLPKFKVQVTSDKSFYLPKE